MAPTYTVEIVFHGAYGLPAADIDTLSCNPYINATLSVPDQTLFFRTPTVRRSRNADWCPTLKDEHTVYCTTWAREAHGPACLSNGRWIVAGVPPSGFSLEMLVMDEDRTHHDDRIGLAAAQFKDLQLGLGFHVAGMEVPIQRRKGNPKVYVLGFIAAFWPTVKIPHRGHVTLSVRVLGPTKDTGSGKVYTLGPTTWSQHFSPVFGSIASARHARPTVPPNLFNELRDTIALPFDPRLRAAASHRRLRPSVFVANTLQLPGPLPPSLTLHFVGYTPWMAWMFDKAGIRGTVLNRLLRKQHRHVYSHDRHTRYGVVFPSFVPASATVTAVSAPVVPPPASPHTEVEAEAAHGHALSCQFLKMCAYGEGARVCTYILTLDGLLRWTETGHQFAVDLLSKHTMHSDVAKDVAFAGEFFVRRIDGSDGLSWSEDRDGVVEHAERGLRGSVDSQDRLPRRPSSSWDYSHSHSIIEDPDPSLYELVIDNASGTYQPSAALLPTLREFLSAPHRLGALGKVTVLDLMDPTLVRIKERRTAERKSERTFWRKRGARSKSTAAVTDSGFVQGEHEVGALPEEQ